MNPLNNVSIIGNLAANPKFLQNQDGSVKVLFSVYAQRDFPDRNGEYKSDSIDVEAYLNAKSVETRGYGPYGHVYEGSQVAIAAHLRKDVYTDKTGQKVYAQKIEVDNISFLESRATTQARQAQKAQQANAQTQAAAAQTPVQPVATPAANAPVAPQEQTLANQLPFTN